LKAFGTLAVKLLPVFLADAVATTGPSYAIPSPNRRLFTRPWAFWLANCKLIFMAEILLDRGFFKAG
jgi:hypothetical protein